MLIPDLAGRAGRGQGERRKLVKVQRDVRGKVKKRLRNKGQAVCPGGDVLSVAVWDGESSREK